LDAAAEYRSGFNGQNLTLFMSLKNIADEDIRLSTSFFRDEAPEAGFGVEAGLRVSF
jgi:iron complex outermembrane receptor protein